MKNAIARNLNDPVLGSAPVIPTDTMEVPETEPVIPVQDLVSEADSHRPELAQARIDLQNRQISRKTVANALLRRSTWWHGTEPSALAGNAESVRTPTFRQFDSSRRVLAMLSLPVRWRFSRLRGGIQLHSAAPKPRCAGRPDKVGTGVPAGPNALPAAAETRSASKSGTRNSWCSRAVRGWMLPANRANWPSIFMKSSRNGRRWRKYQFSGASACSRFGSCGV